MPPKAKGAKAKRSKTKGDDPQAWLETRISELTLALQGRGIFVPAPEDEPASITHSKGATEKRRLTGNTKATQKAMRNMHLQMLEQRALQLERLLNDASSDSGETKSAGGGGRGGVIFGMAIPPGPWTGEGTGGGKDDGSDGAASGSESEAEPEPSGT